MTAMTSSPEGRGGTPARIESTAAPTKGTSCIEVIDAEEANFPIQLMCRCFEVSRSGYYAWRKREPSPRACEEEALLDVISDIFGASRRTYGSPRVHAELLERGIEVGLDRVARIMSEHGLLGRQKPKFRKTTDTDHAMPVAANVLDRNFEATEPDRVWVADITDIWTLEGWMYLASSAGPWVPSPTADRGHPMQHEPKGELLGQRGRRELLLHPQDRTRTRRQIHCQCLRHVAACASHPWALMMRYRSGVSSLRLRSARIVADVALNAFGDHRRTRAARGPRFRTRRVRGVYRPGSRPR